MAAAAVIPAEDALTTDVVGFSADGQSLLTPSSAGEHRRLERLDLATGAVEVLAEDPEADVSGVRVHPDTREPQMSWCSRPGRILGPGPGGGR